VWRKALAAHHQRIHTIEKSDIEFSQTLSVRATLLAAPLAEEKLETRVQRDGQHATAIVEIGQRINTFRDFIDKEEAQLTKLWQQWDEVQHDYARLGSEVFGAETCGDWGVGYRDLHGGYDKEMAQLRQEYQMTMDDVDTEIADIGVLMLKKMWGKEKVRCCTQGWLACSSLQMLIMMGCV
jgi:hypothetical protein